MEESQFLQQSSKSKRELASMEAYYGNKKIFEIFGYWTACFDCVGTWSYNFTPHSYITSSFYSSSNPASITMQYCPFVLGTVFIPTTSTNWHTQFKRRGCTEYSPQAGTPKNTLLMVGITTRIWQAGIHSRRNLGCKLLEWSRKRIELSKDTRRYLSLYWKTFDRTKCRKEFPIRNEMQNEVMNETAACSPLKKF